MPTTPKTKKRYDVNKDYGTESQDKHAWCGYRVVIILGAVSSMLIYTVGAVLSGVAYRSWDRGVNCTLPEDSHNPGSVVGDAMFGYNTPLVVVGPVMMGVGGTIVAVLLLQWCCCRPALTHTFTL